MAISHSQIIFSSDYLSISVPR